MNPIKVALKISLFLFSLLAFGNESFSLTDFQIKKICKYDKKVTTCIKKMQEKRDNLNKGNLIEIPVVPFET